MHRPVTAAVSSAERAEPGYPRPGYAWYVVGVLTVISIVSFLDANILALLVDPVKRDLGINDSQMSLLLGFGYAVFYGVFGIAMGRLADSHNRRTLIAVGCALWSFTTAACGLARTYWQLLLLRMGVGIGEATLFPSAYSLITDYFPKNRLATAMSVFSMSLHLGQGLAYALGGLAIGLVAAYGATTLPIVGEIRSWQVVFLLIGLPGLGLALLVFTVREPVRRDGGPVTGARRDSRSLATPLPQVVRYFWDNRRTLFCLTVGLGLSTLPSYAVWVPSLFIRSYGWSATQTGVVYGLLMAVTGTMGVLAGGRLADWLAERGHVDANMRLCLIVSLAWFPTGILFPLMPTAGWAVALLVPSYFFAGAPWGAAAAALQQIMPSSMRGQATGIYRFALYLLAGAIGPTIVGLTTDYVFHDDGALKYSLAIVGTLGRMACALLFWRGLKHFRASLHRARAMVAARSEASDRNAA